jgi:UDP-2,3-diacylglucosamine hydrolase
MTALKPADIMDVNSDTVVRYLQKYHVSRLIHGHTHRPASHEHALPDGTIATRLVLPEWHEDRAAAWLDDGKELAQIAIEAG